MNGGRGATSRRPRIVYVTSSRGVGGAEELIAALVAGGRRRGWEQTVLNPFANAASVALAERCAPVSYEAQECASVLELPGLRSWLTSRLAELRPDIVHVMLFHATALTASVRRRGERRLLTHVYGEYFAQLPGGRSRAVVDRMAGRRFDHVSAISEAVQTFLTRRYRFPPPPVGCIRLGWSGEPQPPRLGRRPPTIVCVAALRREKGHDTLLAAFVRVRDRIPDGRLVLVGDGPHRTVLERLVRASGLETSVDFVGRVDRIWPYLADADVFALASPSEALGIAVMEAMAAGLPVVATNVGGIPEIVTPGVTGELFRVRDDQELAARLIGLLESPERRMAMSGAALAAAETMRMDQSIERYFDLYDRLLDARATSSGGLH